LSENLFLPFSLPQKSLNLKQEVEALKIKNLKKRLEEKP
jgi:hypothetical protein